MKYVKEELERLIFDEEMSYIKIGELYGVSDAYIKKKSRQLGIKLPVRKKFPKDWKPSNAGTARIKKCANCDEAFNESYHGRKYCSTDCSVEHKVRLKYESYLANQQDYCDKPRSMRFAKKHILREQNNCCDVCGEPDEWKGRKLVLILDHIDGNASNNLRKNLRLVCPNCDSQLPTYKSKNKNSARKERYLRNYKN